MISQESTIDDQESTIFLAPHDGRRTHSEAGGRQIEADRASGMPKRKVLPADYIARRSLYLPENARYDWIMQQASVGGVDHGRMEPHALLCTLRPDRQVAEPARHTVESDRDSHRESQRGRAVRTAIRAVRARGQGRITGIPSTVQEAVHSAYRLTVDVKRGIGEIRLTAE
jgi:hypothetical protein